MATWMLLTSISAARFSVQRKQQAASGASWLVHRGKAGYSMMRHSSMLTAQQPSRSSAASSDQGLQLVQPGQRKTPITTLCARKSEQISDCS